MKYPVGYSRTIIAFTALVKIQKLSRMTFGFTARVRRLGTKEFIMKYLVTCLRTIIAFIDFITIYEFSSMAFNNKS